MASGLLLLLDDIASIMDDVATLTQVAAKKTAGVLGDDLALNAQQVSGVKANRELPVVFAVAKGSLANKAILIPAALALNALAPWSINPLLIFGGAFLCYEGVEKIAHKFLHTPEEETLHHEEIKKAVSDPTIDIVAHEKEKISGAIRTDFILSAEIIVITLHIVAEKSFTTQVGVLVGIGILMTIGVYGLVAAIVKLDDLGAHWVSSEGEGSGAAAKRRLGRWVLAGAPYLMKTLSIAGTVAMFLVGGGILSHGIPAIHHAIASVANIAHDLPGVGGALGFITEKALDGLAGVAVGAIALGIVTVVKKGLRRSR